MTYPNGMIQQNNEYLKEYSLLNIVFFAGAILIIGVVLGIAGFPVLAVPLGMVLDAVLIYRWANTANAISNEKNTVPQILTTITCIAGVISLFLPFPIYVFVTCCILWYLIAKIWRRTLGYNLRRRHFVAIVYLLAVSILFCIFIFVEDDEALLICSILVGLVFIPYYIILQYLFNCGVRFCKNPPDNQQYRGLGIVFVCAFCVAIGVVGAIIGIISFLFAPRGRFKWVVFGFLFCSGAFKAVEEQLWPKHSKQDNQEKP